MELLHPAWGEALTSDVSPDLLLRIWAAEGSHDKVIGERKDGVLKLLEDETSGRAADAVSSESSDSDGDTSSELLQLRSER